VSTAGDALRRLADKVDSEGGRAAVQAMALAGERGIKQNLSLSSHGRGTPTPSPPGSPPSLITGALRRSVITEPPRGGGGLWSASGGPTIVYSRVQELGGRTGRGHRTVLPPRPYVRPAVEQLRVSGRLSEVASSAFYRAVFGG
jgi:hypothetical protein